MNEGRGNPFTLTAGSRSHFIQSIHYSLPFIQWIKWMWFHEPFHSSRLQSIQLTSISLWLCEMKCVLNWSCCALRSYGFVSVQFLFNFRSFHGNEMKWTQRMPQSLRGLFFTRIKFHLIAVNSWRLASRSIIQFVQFHLNSVKWTEWIHSHWVTSCINSFLSKFSIHSLIAFSSIDSPYGYNIAAINQTQFN